MNTNYQFEYFANMMLINKLLIKPLKNLLVRPKLDIFFIGYSLIPNVQVHKNVFYLSTV